MAGATLLALLGCNLLTPVIFIGEHKKRVLPEFDKLAGSRVAVLVWTDPSTLFDYPYARLELATYVAGKLEAEMTQRGHDIDVVDPRRVEALVEKNLHARIDPRAVGEAFDADYVIYLEVIRFQIRDPQQPQFLRGELEASVSVHDMHAEPDEVRRFDLTPVHCLYPEGSPILMSTVNAAAVREATYRKFAEQVARKFYAYTVDL